MIVRVSRRRIAPNPENASQEALDLAVASSDKRARTRLQAIKALLLHIPAEQVAKLFCVCERTLRAWVRAWNKQGIDGLIDRRHPGRPRIIKHEQAQELRGVLEEPERAGRTHWTAVKFHGWLREEMSVEVGYSTVVRLLHELGYRLKVPQPWPDRQDETRREAFRAELRELLRHDDVELWFADESGFEGDPRPRRRWAQRGSRPRITKNGDHLRLNVCGMIAPRTGEAFLLEFSHSDREVFQAFLDEANRDLALERRRQVLVLDNASWHKSRGLRWGRFEPLYLPPYSPDLNPIERLWLVTKAEWFADFTARTAEELEARVDQALLWAMDRARANRQTCAIRLEI